MYVVVRSGVVFVTPIGGGEAITVVIGVTAGNLALEEGMRWHLHDVTDKLEDVAMAVVLTCVEYSLKGVMILCNFLLRKLTLTPPNDSQEQ
jgi:hypothetical protein